MLRMKNNKLNLVLFLFLLILPLVACQPAAPTLQPTEEIPEMPEETGVATVTEVPTNITEEAALIEETEVTPAETEVVEVPELPPEPIVQSFTASDGTELSGLFYPAGAMEAPLLVLMHWAPGDQTDWRSLAAWLQNREYQPELSDEPQPWLDPSWFPEMLEGTSFHVFTFTFRGCEGGCQDFDREGWLLDAAAAMDHIQTLENAEFSQVATIGASIGADGAAYGCHYYNEVFGGCQGALSLSPGGYLTIPYPEVVDDLEAEDPPKPAWCIFSVGDGASANACGNATGAHYRAISYPDSAHGMAMIEPSREPGPLDLILEFLSLTGLCADCS